MSAKTCVIVGAGHAGAQLAQSLRQDGWSGPIIIVGDEPHLPYHRPMLSKKGLAAALDPADIIIRAGELYAAQGIELRLHVRVDAIERETKHIVLAGGEHIAYDVLALATGALARPLRVPGADLPGVFALRNAADADAIRAAALTARRAVIVGGGYIGLEVASLLAPAGLDVTVVEFAPRILERVASPQLSTFMAEAHAARGVTIRTGAAVTGFTGDGKVEDVILADGETLPADLVIVGVGAMPDTRLAEAAGLDVDDGILVDGHGRTSDPSIYAVGDCARFVLPRYGRSLRLESVQHATDQAKAAAAAIAGKHVPYDALPWFWSDQFDLKLQMAGLRQGGEETILRGDPASGSFSVFHLDKGRVVAVEAVNRARDYMMGRQLIERGVAVDVERLADPATGPKDFMER